MSSFFLFYFSLYFLVFYKCIQIFLLTQNSREINQTKPILIKYAAQCNWKCVSFTNQKSLEIAFFRRALIIIEIGLFFGSDAGRYWEPAVLIEGVLFRARYLGSTQLVCEGQPTKSTRMMQAEEAVSRIKVTHFYFHCFHTHIRIHEIFSFFFKIHKVQWIREKNKLSSSVEKS